MTTRNILRTACAASLLTIALGARPDAMMNPAHTMTITFSQPIRLPGVALAAGSYIFEVANPMSSADVVRVLSRDRKTSYFQGFAYKAQKPRNVAIDSPITLGEPSAKGSPAPILFWWHERTGHQLIYQNP